MKRFSKAICLALAFLMLAQGVRVSASCAKPCKMDSKSKIDCVVASLLLRARFAYSGGPALQAGASACGKLELHGPSQSLESGKAQLQEPGFGRELAVLPASAGALPAAFRAAMHCRAGPSASPQALRAIPPQNAPPALA
jgi:hypothetical protein